MRLPRQKINQDFQSLAHQLENKGLMKAEYQDGRVELQMDYQASNEFSFLLQSYYLRLMAMYTGIPGFDLQLATDDIIYYIPLDEAYVPPVGGGYETIAQRWELERYWDLLTLSATVSFLKESVKSVAAASLKNIKVRPILPSELGGYYNNGAVGPNLSAISGTNYRTFGTIPITLNQGVNSAVVNMQTTANQLYNVVFVIHKIRDVTVPQNAVGFIFSKNNTPYPPIDYSATEPWIFVPWSRNSYRYSVIGLLTPPMIAPNQSFQANVYSTATSTEQLFFEGFVAYVGPS